MSDTSDDLMLYLRLDALAADGVLRVDSGQAYSARLLTGGRVREDAVMSSYLELAPGDAGTAIEVEAGDAALHPPERALTISLWVYVPDPGHHELEIVGYDPDFMKPPYVDYQKEEFKLSWTTIMTGDGLFGSVSSLFREGDDCVRGDSSRATVEPGTWYHLAVVFSADGYFVYAHDAAGQILCGKGASGILTLTRPYIRTAKASRLLVRSGSSLGHRIAHLRLHHCALHEEQIKNLMIGDLGGHFHTPKIRLAARRHVATDAPPTASNESTHALHPVHFSLADDSGHHVLYIDDSPEERQLVLELRNTSERDIEFVSLPSDSASPDNHHLALQFRPGTLSKSSVGALTAADAARVVLGEYAHDWDLHVPTRTTAQDAVTIYLLRRRGGNYEDGLLLPLRHMTAASGGGTRPTRVELRLGSMRYVGTDHDIVCRRTTTLHIMWQPALDVDRPGAPIHVGLPATHSLLNDGQTENTLQVRVSNISGKNLQPKFELGVDVDVDGEDRWWAFGSKDDVARISIEERWPGQPRGHEAGGGPKNGLEESSGRCILRTPPQGLRAGEHLDIELSKITTVRQGNTNIYLYYRNIPGFRPGCVTLSVARSPLALVDYKLGVGTNTPEQQLELSGQIKSESLTTRHANTEELTASHIVATVIEGKHTMQSPNAAHNIGNPQPGHSVLIQPNLEVSGLSRSQKLQISDKGPIIDEFVAIEGWLENDRVPTVAWIKKHFGWLAHAIDAVELPIEYPTKNGNSACAGYATDASHNPTPPLSCYLIGGRTILLTGSFYVQQGRDSLIKDKLYPRIARYPKPKIPAPQAFRADGGDWWILPDGSIQPRTWNIRPGEGKAPIITVNLRYQIA